MPRGPGLDDPRSCQLDDWDQHVNRSQSRNSRQEPGRPGEQCILSTRWLAQLLLYVTQEHLPGDGPPNQSLMKKMPHSFPLIEAFSQLGLLFPANPSLCQTDRKPTSTLTQDSRKVQTTHSPYVHPLYPFFTPSYWMLPPPRNTQNPSTHPSAH